MSAKTNILSKKDDLVLFLVYFLLPLMSYAGGLGIAAVLFCAGVLGLLGHWSLLSLNSLKKIPYPIWGLLVFLLWAWLSSLWSPYHAKAVLSNADKLAFALPFYLGFAALVYAKRKQGVVGLLHKILIICLFLFALLLLFDVLTNYSWTLWVDPVGDGEDIIKRRGDIMQNLGHHVSVQALLFAPLMVVLWLKAGVWRAAGVALAVLFFTTAIMAGMNAGVMAMLAALLFMGLASFKPRLSLWLGFVCAGLAVLCAPILAFIAKNIGPELRAKLPFSWEERVATWGYMYDKVLQKPLFGHGFDAVRTFNDTHTIRGFEGRALVSLHPHNAGLHIWAETGFVGVSLACLALFLAARFLTKQGRLAKAQMIAVSGLLASVLVISEFSYGVWQDWWWAAIIFAAAQIILLPERDLR